MGFNATASDARPFDVDAAAREPFAYVCSTDVRGALRGDALPVAVDEDAFSSGRLEVDGELPLSILANPDIAEAA